MDHSEFDDCLTDYINSIGHIREVCNWLSTPPALTVQALPVNRSMCCGCVLLLSGYFESFLKDSIETFINKLNSLNIPIESIPREMVFQHFEGGAEHVKAYSKKDRFESVDLSLVHVKDFLDRLSSITTGQDEYQLVWEAFANTKSNPNTDVVKDLLSNIGIKQTWPQINDLATNKGQLDVFLKSFIAVRNICAHTGTHNTPPSPSEIFEFCDNFEEIATCLMVLLSYRICELEELKTGPKGNQKEQA